MIRPEPHYCYIDLTRKCAIRILLTCRENPVLNVRWISRALRAAAATRSPSMACRWRKAQAWWTGHAFCDQRQGKRRSELPRPVCRQREGRRRTDVRQRELLMRVRRSEKRSGAWQLVRLGEGGVINPCYRVYERALPDHHFPTDICPHHYQL